MCNGLRNWLVYRYSKIDKKLVLDSIAEVKITLEKFIKKVKDVLEKITS